jgi:hypothetical protein
VVSFQLSTHSPILTAVLTSDLDIARNVEIEILIASLSSLPKHGFFSPSLPLICRPISLAVTFALHDHQQANRRGKYQKDAR